MARPVLWIDITELFAEFAHAAHPTGVSRVVISLADELAASPGDTFAAVRFVFWDPVRRDLFACDPRQTGPLAAFLPTLGARYREAGLVRPSLRSGLKKGLVSSLPRPLRFWLFPHLHGSRQFLRWARGERLALASARIGQGDCLFVPGSFWLGGYGPTIARRARGAGASVAAFVHDVLLLSHPEWMPGRHADQFRRGAMAFLPQCAAIICNSDHTRDELRRHVPLPPAVVMAVCRLGDRLAAAPGTLPAQLANMPGGRFALYVSSLIPRKNHRLLAEAWTLLWRELSDETPTLVFAGGGHPDAALAQALKRDAAAGGRIVRISGASDAELAALYRDAWITLYPSLAEGYGLPVAEALGMGKACLAAATGGTAEVAPGLIDRIDPNDAADVAAMVADYLRDPGKLAAREASIRTGFTPTSWPQTAAAVRGALERSLAAS